MELIRELIRTAKVQKGSVRGALSRRLGLAYTVVAVISDRFFRIPPYPAVFMRDK